MLSGTELLSESDGANRPLVNVSRSLAPPDRWRSVSRAARRSGDARALGGQNDGSETTDDDNVGGRSVMTRARLFNPFRCTANFAILIGHLTKTDFSFPTFTG